jgi:hypothetical protein
MTVLKDESGGVTVDFVVIMSAVVAMAMLIAPIFGPPYPAWPSTSAKW